ncbi:MAG: excinuclease ABC subunit UvrA, partial [Kiritimatiellaeota bacterium]|nr:excinuclease ABC subunit UvrA [Kiritimatiellota bacterium]
MNSDAIIIQGARTHNLKNVTVRIPRDTLTVITGLSGSGKSSLAFDTLFAEGQRRYVESLSAYARQFLDQMGKPDVDHVEGLSPAISIEQRSASANPRSIVATTTEIMDYLRLLYANAAQAHCPKCGKAVFRRSAEQLVEYLLALPVGDKIMIMAPLARQRTGDMKEVVKGARSGGFVRLRIDGELHDIDDVPALNPKEKHTVEAVVDRLVMKTDIRSRLTDSVETALKHGQGIISVKISGNGFQPLSKNQDQRQDAVATVEREELLSEKNVCVECGIVFEELKPATFSFNSPVGACPTCDGLGTELYFDEAKIVPDETVSLAGGAIEPWRRGPRWLIAGYTVLLKSLVAHAGVSMDTPWKELPKAFRKLLMQGSGETEIALGTRFRRSFRKTVKPFEGIMENLRRRMSETPNDNVKEMLREYMSSRRCAACNGKRLRPESLAATISIDASRLKSIHVDASRNLGIMSFLEMPVGLSRQWMREYQAGLSPTQKAMVGEVVEEIATRLDFLDNVGLGYLTLDRESATLSGGEMQRIRLATQIGSGLVGVLYVLDEPTIGLHARDNARLVDTLRSLQRRGNTVVVVEHDEVMIREADYVIDLGPGAGRRGGEVVFAGTVPELLERGQCLTAEYLRGERAMAIPKKRVKPTEKVIRVKGASVNNLKNVDVSFPLGCLIAVTGVSGSGKSTLVHEVLRKTIEESFTAEKHRPPVFDWTVSGLEHVDKMIVIDQDPIGRTPRSNPATYTGAFNLIRDLFAATPLAKARGYLPGRFSFNVKGGRCEVCKGDGVMCLEMHFLPDVYVPCEQCAGKRYNRETLDIRFGGRTIAEVLEMTIDEAVEAFAAVPKLKRILEMLQEVGLGYLQVGQSATTLSGGEAQRVKLATELCRPEGKGHTLYLLDEPTTGLHFEDTKKLMDVLVRLRDKGHTVLIIEHNLDVIKMADHIIDLGPEGGDAGGTVLATGTPEAIAKNPASYTGHFLSKIV